MVECAVQLHLLLRAAETQSNAVTHITLAHITIEENQEQHFCKVIHLLPVISVFSLKHCKIAQSVIIAVSEELKERRNIETLEIVNCGLAVLDCLCISQFLSVQSVLETIDFTRNPLGNDGLALLANALPSTIRKIAIADCGLTANACKSLSGLFAKATNLEYIDISRNKLTGAGIENLCWGLQKLGKLKVLRMSAVECGLHFADSLSPSLSQLGNLECFEAAANHIGNTAFLQLLKPLRKLQSLQSINLMYNDIDEDCLRELADSCGSLIPLLLLSFVEGDRWMECKEKCGQCEGFCLQYSDLCSWRRRRVVLGARVRIQRLMWAG